MKQKCSKCKKLKYFNEYTKDRSRKNNIYHRCKKCQKLLRFKQKEYHKIRGQKYYKNNKNKINLKNKKRYIKNKFLHNNQTKKWREINPERFRELSLKNKYGINLNEFKEMLFKQNNLCKICLKPEIVKYKDGKIKNLSVDHCHKTGEVRGLLCNKCNNGLGSFEDNYNLLYKAIKYLKKEL